MVQEAAGSTIGEKVDGFRMVLKVQSGKRSKKVFKMMSNRKIT
jgi:hypothetical protein